MLRLSCKAPLVAATLLRFQSSNAAGAPSGAGGPPGMRRRNRRFRGTWALPRFEIHDVRDEPANGTMTRVAIDEKNLLISQFPQLGPRKMDPNDASPQFDRERRISVRLRHMDLAALVSVVEGRLPTHHMKNNAYDLLFEKTADGYTLKGHVHRAMSTKSEDWTIQFDKQFATTLEHFLESALTESFGFARYQAYQARLQRSENQDRNWNGGNGRGNGEGRGNFRGENRQQRQQAVQ